MQTIKNMWIMYQNRQKRTDNKMLVSATTHNAKNINSKYRINDMQSTHISTSTMNEENTAYDGKYKL